MSGLKNFVCKDMLNVICDYWIGDLKHWKNEFKEVIQQLEMRYLRREYDGIRVLKCSECGEINCVNNCYHIQRRDADNFDKPEDDEHEYEDKYWEEWYPLSDGGYKYAGSLADY